ncbi:MAG: 2-oxoglutarate dehydrogenase complex dihydrolipoyllysine-residue succinyltransferase [Alphaproteobacteria bacterium]
MTTKVNVPTLGESVSSATIAGWKIQEGDFIKEGDTLVELETDKVSLEVPAPISGVITAIKVAEGDEVELDALLCEMEASDAPAAGTAAPKTEAPKAASAPENKAQAASTPTPAAAKLMAEKGLSAGDVNASGAKGNILKEDVAAATKAAHASQHASQPASQPAMQKPSTPKLQDFTPQGTRKNDERGEERVKMSKLRKVIASRLKEAQNTAAMLTTFNEVDMGPMMAIRSQYKEAFEKKHGTKLGFMSFFVKAATMILKELPAVNAEIYGDEIIYKNYYDIGIAVGTPQGLVVPVLRNADQLSFAEIEGGIADFGARARAGKLTLAEMQGGSFTITNGGVFGSLLSTPILNPPQSGILGMHKIQKRPIVNDKGEIVAANMMYLAHSYDHRIIDGKEAVTFLVRLKALLEDPSRLLLDL